MKKSIVSLLATILMAAGLVAGGFASTPAAADPYPGSVITNCKVTAKDRVQGDTGRIKALVNVPGSKIKPKGPIKVIVRRVGGGFRQVFSKTTKGKLERFTTKRLVKKGTYRVKLKYRPAADSQFVRCTEKTVFSVS
jgi:hypothetical protein